jgi:Zn-dependent M28 family amino/carboxypeptidase
VVSIVHAELRRSFHSCLQLVNLFPPSPLHRTSRPQVVVVGAHMDSLPTGATAPGAVDNGSGTVGLLVLARAFAKHSWNRTIEFVAFGAEEQGIHGSAEYVRRAQQDGVNIISALCMDMIAYSNIYFGVTIEVRLA